VLNLSLSKDSECPRSFKRSGLNLLADPFDSNVMSELRVAPSVIEGRGR